MCSEVALINLARFGVFSLKSKPSKWHKLVSWLQRIFEQHSLNSTCEVTLVHIYELISKIQKIVITFIVLSKK